MVAKKNNYFLRIYFQILYFFFIFCISSLSFILNPPLAAFISPLALLLKWTVNRIYLCGNTRWSTALERLSSIRHDQQVTHRLVFLESITYSEIQKQLVITAMRTLHLNDKSRNFWHPQLLLSLTGYIRQCRLSPSGAHCAESAPCHRMMESQNNLIWKRHIRIIKTSSWYVSYTEMCPKCEKNVVAPEGCRGYCLTAQMFFKLCFLFLQQACAILVLKPLKKEITLEIPKQDDM